MEVVGLDVSKATLDVTLIKADGQKHQTQFSNDDKGHKKLNQWLKKKEANRPHICMEATNIYWEAVAEYLHDQSYPVSVVNPARIKGFAMSQLRRNKTDKLDADVIAQFCQALKPKLWLPPTPEQRHLRALVRHQQALQKSSTQYKNRLAVTTHSLVRDSIKTLIENLNAEIERLEEQIQTFIAQTSDLKEQQTLLVSIIGFGVKTATILLAEMYDLATYESARAAAADAGVTPAHYSSGSSVRRKPKLSKIGKTTVRGALYFPAITAIQHNPIIRDLKERLEAQGKEPKVIIGAAMRKLLHLAYGVLKHRNPFDPNYLSPSVSS
jgi:transposase